MPRPTEASRWWAARASEYDGFIRRVIPPYDAILAQLTAFLPARAERVLELGCGTGNVTLALAQRLPQAQLVVVDASPEMIEVARARLRERAPAARARFVAAAFETLPFTPAGFDLVVSGLSLHHVADKASLFRDLERATSPGGTLAFADGLAGAGARNAARIWERYVGPWAERCSEDEVRDLLEHAERHDHYATLREHFAHLEAAGYTDCDCVWRDGFWTVVTAEKPPAPPAAGP